MGYLGYKPADKPLTSADITDSIITSAKITDATIVNGDIANSTINLTTKVTGTLPVANGGTGLATIGTANQVLAVNSGATALEYQSVSSDYVKLASTTASSSSTISFDGYFSSTYRYYTCYYDSVVPSGSAAQMRLRYRQGNADVTSSSYKFTATQTYTDGAGGASVTQGEGAASLSSIKLIGFSSYSTATSPWNGLFTIYNPLGTTNHKHITGITSVNHDGSYHATENVAGFFYGNTTALSGITFFPHTGNFVSGTFTLYGIK